MESRTERNPVVIAIVVGIIVVISLAIFLIMNPLVVIKAGQRGVVLHWGAVTETVLGEGIHWVWPISNSVERMNVTIRKLEVQKATASSKDLQSVHTNIAINYQLDPLKVNKIYQNFRKEYEERIVFPAILEHLKASTAKFTAEELITKREQVKVLFSDHMKTALSPSGIRVTDVFITDFGFSPSFAKAIEEKVTAEQEALQQKNTLERRKYEAEQVVVKAKAEAEAIRIQAQAITQQGGKDYVQLKAIERWNGVLPNNMIPGGAVPFVSLEYIKANK